MKKFIKRYLFFIITALILAFVFTFFGDIGKKAVDTTLYTLWEMLLVIPPIFVLLGLLDVWVPRETMVRFMGEGSGARGIILAIVLGSAAAGPLYAAFPVAAVFMKKGAKFSNVLLFIGAWSTTKVPMVLFEISSLGAKFAMTRLALSLIGISIIAFVLNKIVSKEQQSLIYERAKML